MVSLGTHRDVNTKTVTGASSEKSQLAAGQEEPETKVNTFMDDNGDKEPSLRIESKAAASPVGKNHKILAIDN